jgi:Protein of unknown function (DUF1064)
MKGRNFHVAEKTECAAGHTHDSRAEAKRCSDLHVLLRAGRIAGLNVSPRFYFEINGQPIKMSNGHIARYTGDFTYIEGNRQVVEDVKPSGGLMERDFPLRFALVKALYPDIDFRVVK